MKKTEGNVKDLAKGILEYAQKLGVDTDAWFKTSYHLLEVQIDMLEALEKSYKEDGATITKEYVKGRENVYVHPAIDKYTKTSDSAFNKILKIKEMMEKSTTIEEDISVDDLINGNY